MSTPSLPPHTALGTGANGIEQYEVRSGHQSAATRLRILRPAGARNQADLLFVLPVEAGAGAHYGDGLAEVHRLGLHERLGVAAVAPDFAQLPWYANHPDDPARQDERYLTEDLLPLLDHLVPGAGRRLLLGFSKSGWGALSLLLRHPRLFTAACVWDAPLMQERPDRFQMEGAFVSQRNFERYRIASLLADRAAEFRGEQPRIHLLGAANFAGQMREAHLLMTALGVAHSHREADLEEHTWHSGWMADVLLPLSS